MLGPIDYLPRIVLTNGFFGAIENVADAARDKAYVFRLVRGGSVSPEWEEGLRDSNRIRQIFLDEADKFKKSLEAHDKRAKELQEKNARQEEEYTAWYQSETKRLRAGVKKAM